MMSYTGTPYYTQLLPFFTLHFFLNFFFLNFKIRSMVRIFACLDFKFPGSFSQCPLYLGGSRPTPHATTAKGAGGGWETSPTKTSTCSTSSPTTKATRHHHRQTTTLDETKQTPDLLLLLALLLYHLTDKHHDHICCGALLHLLLAMTLSSSNTSHPEHCIPMDSPPLLNRGQHLPLPGPRPGRRRPKLTSRRLSRACEYATGFSRRRTCGCG